jgi:hypothetical protein
MLFIVIAWLLTVVTFIIFLRALHTIPIYAHTELELQGQKLQLQTVFIMTKILLSVALTLLMLHFTLPDTIQQSIEDTNLSVTIEAYNSSL